MNRSKGFLPGTSFDVLMVANTLPPNDLSGAGEQIVQLSSGLEALGHRVRILGRGPRGAFGPKVLFPVTVVWPLLRELWRRPPDVVQVHESDGGLAALAVRFLSPRPRPKLIALQQVSYKMERSSVRPLIDRSNGDRVLATPNAEEHAFRRFKTPLQILLGRITARVCDLVVVPSVQTGEELRRDYGVKHCQVVPNVTGAALGPTTTSPEEGDALEGGYFLFVGRLRIRKGLEILLEALTDSPSARLVIAGDGERRSELIDAIERLGLSDRVDFLGKQPRERLSQLLTGALALVVPSIYEGMPLVILEAMEQEVPVVASAVSGIPEIVVDGETGWLVPPEDVQSLRAALLEVTDAPLEAHRRGREGRLRLETHYRPRHAAELWQKVIEDL